MGRWTPPKKRWTRSRRGDEREPEDSDEREPEVLVQSHGGNKKGKRGGVFPDIQ
jgi:hypothetical protein